MSLIRINQEVEYESLRTPRKMFRGRVRLVQDDRAVVEHDTEPKWVTVELSRLTHKPRRIPIVHKGRTA